MGARRNLLETGRLQPDRPRCRLVCEINWGGGLTRGTKGRALPSRDAPGVNYQADVALKIEKRCRPNEREARRRLNRFFINVGSPYVLNSDYDIELPSPSSRPSSLEAVTSENN